jgi:hypothetical protein
MAEEKYLTVKTLIEALQKLDNQDATVLINIKQYNQKFGVVQLPIVDTLHPHNFQWWVDHSYQGATITIHLPDGAYIAKLPNKYK